MKGDDHDQGSESGNHDGDEDIIIKVIKNDGGNKAAKKRNGAYQGFEEASQPARQKEKAQYSNNDFINQWH